MLLLFFFCILNWLLSLTYQLTIHVDDQRKQGVYNQWSVGHIRQARCCQVAREPVCGRPEAGVEPTY